MYSKEFCKLPEEYKQAILKEQTGYPVSIGNIAKALGLTVKGSTLSSNISGKITKKNEAFIIRVNRHEPKYRQRFTVAHEIAHYLLHREHIDNDGIIDTVLYSSHLPSKMEGEANRLAADIIMPWSLLSEVIEGEDIEDPEFIDEIAHDFGVSKVAMAVMLGVEV